MHNPIFPPFMASANGQMNHPKAKLLASILRNYDLHSTVAQIAGMSTIPRFQANSYRIEFLTLLAVSCCNGKVCPSWNNLDHWLNRHLGISEIARMEDPAEDVFVVNVLTTEGDFRVLGGLWEAAESSTTLLIETLNLYGGDEQRSWLRPALALLRLSDVMLDRAGLTRWQMESSHPKKIIPVIHKTPLKEWSQHVVFQKRELSSLGIDHELLAPFVFDLSTRMELFDQNNQESDLHRKPLLRFGDEYVIALPNAVTYAIRRYLIDCADKARMMGKLQSSLMMCVQRRLFQTIRYGSRHRIEPVAIPREYGGVDGVCRSIVVRVGGRRYLHFLLGGDDLRQMASTGLLIPSELSSTDQQKVDEHVEALRNYLESSFEVDSAHTLWIMGHLGQAYVGAYPLERPLWTFTSVRLSDLEIFFRDPDDPVDRLVLLLNQEKHLRQEGLEIPFQNGILNFYAFWVKEDFYLRISDMPHDQSSYLQIGTDFVAGYRAARRRAVDEHCEKTLNEGFVIVQRGNSEAIYESLRSVPAYVSIDHLARGRLSFCLKHRGTVVWLSVIAPSEGLVKESAFKLWEALQLLLHKALGKLSHVMQFDFPVIEITIDVQQVLPQTEIDEEPLKDAELSVIRDQHVPVVRLVAGKHFLKHFKDVENTGEQLLLSQLIRALTLLSSTAEAQLINPIEEAMSILGGIDARVLHSFRMHYDVDYLIASDSRRVYKQPIEQIKFASRAAFTWRASLSRPVSFDKDASVRVLNEAVSKQIERLLILLKRFDRVGVISEMLHLHETLLREKTRWRSTARAVRALYGVEDGTRAAGTVERERAQLKVTIRALVEAAICECTNTGVRPDEYSLDEMVGLMSSIIDLGRESDVVYYGLSGNGLVLYPNGGHSLDADILAQFARPYVDEAFGKGYALAARDYESWVGLRKDDVAENSDSMFDSANFLEAWQAEYGLTFSSFQEIAGELQELAVKRGAVIVKTSIEEVAAGRKDEGVTVADVEAFMKAFGLTARSTWAAQPPVLYKDVNPWRFQRRLSLTLRPIVVCSSGDQHQLIYGVGTFRESIGHLLSSIQNATFDKDVFISTKMRSLIGSRVDLLGRSFSLKVAAFLINLGWNAVSEVKLSQLGAGKTPNLGDVDVFAWHRDGRVLAIECKRLRQSKTIAELAQACNRFQGNSGDHMYKHLRRADWLKKNIAQVAKFTKLSAELIRVRYPLVVNSPVPFKYLEKLPMAASDIVNFDELGTYI